MTKKTAFTLIGVLLLAGFSVYVNRHRFQAEPLRVGSRSVPPRGPSQRRQQDSAVNPILFLLSREDTLTSVKVIPLSDIQTNKYPHAIWELNTDSNSVPTRNFAYGANIRGMKPAVVGARPAPLEPGVPYRLMVEAGSGKAEHDFTPVARAR